MEYPKDPLRSHLDVSDEDLERGYSDAMTPDGHTRSNNDGLRTAYEDGIDSNYEDDQESYPVGPARDDWDDAVGMLDRPGQNYRTLIRRN